MKLWCLISLSSVEKLTCVFWFQYLWTSLTNFNYTNFCKIFCLIPPFWLRVWLYFLYFIWSKHVDFMIHQFQFRIPIMKFMSAPEYFASSSRNLNNFQWFWFIRYSAFCCCSGLNLFLFHINENFSTSFRPVVFV